MKLLVAALGLDQNFDSCTWQKISHGRHGYNKLAFFIRESLAVPLFSFLIQRVGPFLGGYPEQVIQ